MSKPPPPIPILLRRQSRPAPSYGPNHAPRPPVIVPPSPPPAAAAKPEPKPEPKPGGNPARGVTPPPPPARPALPSIGAELPVAALVEADVPPGTSVRLGTLSRTRNQRTGRPLFVLAVPCNCHRRVHWFPWRGDWPVDASVRSHQANRCAKHKSPDGVWLALDPKRLEISQQASEEGRADFERWKAWWDSLSAEQRKAIWKGRGNLPAEFVPPADDGG
jgi:hypothetical protein